MGNLPAIPDKVPKYKASQYVNHTPGVNSYKFGENTVFWRGQPIYTINRKTFIDVGGGYGSDSQSNYYNGRKLDGLGNVVYIGNGRASVGKGLYMRGVRIVNNTKRGVSKGANML
jgi:hypothetical protein